MEKLDYSPHFLEAKNKLNEIHKLLLKNEFALAAAKTEFVLAELRLMKAAINSHVK